MEYLASGGMIVFPCLALCCPVTDPHFTACSHVINIHDLHLPTSVATVTVQFLHSKNKSE